MRLEVQRTNQQSLYLQIVEQIKEHIRSGHLPQGARLPAIRELAGKLGLTRLTVHNAYAELQAQGWIESYVGRGSFVAARPVMPAPPPRHHFPTRRLSAMSDLIRLTQQPGLLSFAQAAPAAETYPVREFNRIVQQVAGQDESDLYAYGRTQGDPLLREQLSVFLLDRMVRALPEQIIVTGGATQGIDLVLRALVEPGQTVLVEEPTYLGLVERMEVQGLRLHGVPVDDEGIVIEALEDAIARWRPRLLYTIPTFHNPTGVSLSEARRAELLRLAKRHQFVILEDDIYAHLAYDGPAPLPLRAADRAGTVVYVTSFSKMLMPGLRLGLVVADPPLLDRLIAEKRLADMHAPTLLQRALAHYLRRGHFAAHLRAARTLYRERRDTMLARIQQDFPPEVVCNVPSGGLCLWLRLPPHIRATELLVEAVERGVAFAPGQMFSPGAARDDFMRLSWAAHSPEQITRGIAILGELLHDHLCRDRRYERSPTFAIPLV